MEEKSKLIFSYSSFNRRHRGSHRWKLPFFTSSSSSCPWHTNGIMAKNCNRFSIKLKKKSKLQSLNWTWTLMNDLGWGGWGGGGWNPEDKASILYQILLAKWWTIFKGSRVLVSSPLDYPKLLWVTWTFEGPVVHIPITTPIWHTLL